MPEHQYQGTLATHSSGETPNRAEWKSFELVPPVGIEVAQIDAEERTAFGLREYDGHGETPGPQYVGSRRKIPPEFSYLCLKLINVCK